MQTLRISLLFLAKLFLLLMGYYFFLRAVFMLYYVGKLSQIDAGVGHILYAFISALSVDIATACYVLALTWPVITIYLIWPKPALLKILRAYLWGAMLFSLLIAIGELGVYGEWGEKPGFEVLTYLMHPSEIINSNPLKATMVFLLFLALTGFGTWKILGRVVRLEIPQKRSWTGVGGFFLMALVVLTIGARGGVGHVPITQSDALYSHRKILNDAAINTGYNFIHSVVWNQQLLGGKNPYVSHLPSETKQTIQALLLQQPSSKTIQILDQKRPNIVLVILESWAGEIGEATHADIAPYFHELAKEGLQWTHTIASGTLSHEGVPAILSGWPAIPEIYITNAVRKHAKLPSLGKSFKSQGYETLFLYGGQLQYGNMSAYLYASGFDHIYEEKDFPLNTPRSPLGVHDEYAFEKFFGHIERLNHPYFATIFTASSHSPYAQPMEDVIFHGGEHRPFWNSVYYADRSIKAFMQKMQNLPEYENTLFVFIGDHSHMTPKNLQRNTPEGHHVVMLLYGEPLKKAYRGKKITQIVSQHDIPTTLLAQLDIEHEAYLFSRNILADAYNASAFFGAHGLFGFLTPKGTHTLHSQHKHALINTLSKEATIEALYSEVYMDKLMSEFLAP